MKKEKCTAPDWQGRPVGPRHEIRVTDPVLEMCPLEEIAWFVGRHEALDQLPCSFRSGAGKKVVVKTTAERSATLVFLPVEREEAEKGFAMRELTEENVLS